MIALSNLKTISWDIGNGATYRPPPRDSKGRIIRVEVVNEKPGLKRSLSDSFKKKLTLWKKDDKIENGEGQLTSIATNITQTSTSKEKGKATVVDTGSHA